MRSPPILHLALRESRRTTAVIVGAGVATAVLVALLPVPPGIRTGMLLGCLAEVARALAAARHPGGVFRLGVGVDRRVRVTDRRGVTRYGDVLDDTFVSGQLTVMVFRLDGCIRTRSFLVAPDTLSPADRRRLRVRLRLGVREPGSSLATVTGPPVATDVRVA